MNTSRWMCGVDKGICTGSTLVAGGHLGKVIQAHGDPAQAFKCKRRSLLLQGYTQIGPREFCKDGGPILVLNKKTRFGFRVRWAKDKSRYLAVKSDKGAII